MGWNIRCGNFLGGNFLGGNSPGEEFAGWEFSGWQFTRWGNFPRVAIIFTETIDRMIWFKTKISFKWVNEMFSWKITELLLNHWVFSFLHCKFSRRHLGNLSDPPNLPSVFSSEKRRVVCSASMYLPCSQYSIQFYFLLPKEPRKKCPEGSYKYDLVPRGIDIQWCLDTIFFVGTRKETWGMSGRPSGLSVNKGISTISLWIF